MRRATSNVMLAARSSALNTVRETAAACRAPVGADGIALMLPGNSVLSGLTVAACTLKQHSAAENRRSSRGWFPLTRDIKGIRPG